MAQNKKTVAELKNELYIATLIEKHQNDNLWLTTIMKDTHEAYQASIIENAPKYIKDVARELDAYSKTIFPIYKEEDLLLYLLLKYSVSNVEHSKLNEQELLCAKNCLLADIEFDSEQLSFDIVAERLKERFSSPLIVKEKIKDIIANVCNDGVRCYEPFSHLLCHSEQIVLSLEYLVIYKSLSCIISESKIEEIKNRLDSGYNSSDYPDMSWEEGELQHEEDVKKLAEEFVCNEKTHLIKRVGKSVSPHADIWECANYEKYDSVLLSFSDKRANTINVLECNSFDIDAIRDHVEENGYIVVLWDLDLISNSDSLGEKLTEFKKSLAKHHELDAYIPGMGLWSMEAFILKKGKKDKYVQVFYHNDYSENYSNDLLQCRTMSNEDLAAIGYDLSLANMLPSIHASSGETFLPLSNFLEASKDEYLRLKQTEFGKVFTPDNYASSFETFVVNPANLRESQVDDKWKKVTEPVFVIRRNPFAVAFVNASADQPVYFKDQVMTFSVKESVIDPNFLYLLSTNGRLEQVVKDCPEVYFLIDDYTLYTDERNVSYVGSWPAKSLLRYKGLIAIPSLLAQREQCEIAEKAERNRIDRVAMAQYRQDIHERKHALGQIMLQMRSSWDALVFAKEENNGCIDDNYVYGKKHPHTIKHIFESIDSYMNELGTGIDSFTPEDNIIYQEKEQIYIKDYLEDYVKTHSNPCYDFEIVSDSTSSGKESFVFSKRALDTILQNIVFNAWKHGFVGRSQGNVIRLSWKEEDETVQVFVSNNGIPLAASMSNEDIFKFGKTTSRGQDSVDGHHHLGLGCYQVWCLMRDKGQGDVFCISEPKKEFPVTFKLVFNK